MKTFRVVPQISCCDTFREFADHFQVGNGDILVTNRRRYEKYVKPVGVVIPVLFREDYGKGEPTDEMIDAMGRDMEQYDAKRIIAFGGGTIVDMCKVLALDLPERSQMLFTGDAAPKKIRELIIIPTTCGTGSEVTNVTISELKSLHVKKGLAAEETYADHAVLIPESLQDLPDYVFATSSIDALIHSLESFLSPKASSFSEMYSLKAMEIIMGGYKTILERGGNSAENREDLLQEFGLAATYAGIAFGNAGCGAVHALSYSIGAAFHVPHGEANYQFFTEVFKTYMKREPEGRINRINSVMADILGCEKENVYEEIEKVLDQLIPRKPLREYGMTEEQIDTFTDSTLENQQRLLANNYVSLDRSEIHEIFAKLR